MRLFHYSNFLSLPAILREGITKGELPLNPQDYTYGSVHAANLTTNKNPKDQEHWATGGVTNKTRIRYTVDVPAGELTNFQQFCERFKPSAEVIDAMDPHGERRRWFYAFNGVAPSHIVLVSKWENGAYRPMTNDQVTELTKRVSDEIERALVLTPQALSLKPGVTESWLIDGP